MKTKQIIQITMFLNLISFVGFAQDTLELRNGTTVLGKVIEISAEEIKYKEAENMDGPVYTKNTKNVRTIKYGNGRQESFTEITSSIEPKKNNTSATPVFNAFLPGAASYSKKTKIGIVAFLAVLSVLVTSLMLTGHTTA